MEKIQQQVAVARRRMVAQQFFGIMAWSLFASLILTAVGLAVPKIWVLPGEAAVWAAAVTTLKMEAPGPFALGRAAVEQLIRERY